VFAEIDALARREGSSPETFAGLAGAGDLVATVLAEGSRNRRAGEMLAEGVPAEDIDSALGQTAEAVACVPLLAERVQAAGVDAPALKGLAGVIEGEVDASAWTESLTAPRPTPKRPEKVRATPEEPSAAKSRLDADFTALYKAHLKDVYSYSYYRVGNHHDAEDLTEQTFLQAYRHFERAQRESEGRPLRPWLIRIAHNLAANYYRDRSRKPQTPIDDASTISATHTTEALVEDRDDLKRILECVQDLPDDRREALIMRFALGMDNREIARALGRTDGATKVLLHRAIKQLEELVQKAEGPV
jgi:RNA polymerase sigma-70 factor, ECF subfamily